MTDLDKEGALKALRDSITTEVKVEKKLDLSPIMRVVFQIAVPNEATGNTVDLITTEGFIKLGPDATAKKVTKLMSGQINDAIKRWRTHKPSAIVKAETLAPGVQ